MEPAVFEILSSWLSAAAAPLADAAIKAAAVLSIAGLLSLALRRASSALRHAVWFAAVCGALALPLLSLALPAWRVPLDLAPAAAPVASEPTRAEPGAPAAQAVVPAGVGSSDRAQEAERREWTPALVIVWLVGAMLVAGRTAAAALRVRGIAMRAGLAGAEWTAAARAAARRLGLEREVPLLVSDRVAAPATWGVRRPVVLLPLAAFEWPEGQRVAALLHEFAHVTRRDCATQLAAQIACAVYWFNPMVWVAARALRDEREQAADDRVLGAGVKASDYAGLLLEVARATPSPLAAPAASFAGGRRSHLERRVRAVLDPRRRRQPGGRTAASGAVLAVTCVVAPLTAARPAATPFPMAAPETPTSLSRRSREVTELPERAGSGPASRSARQPAAAPPRVAQEGTGPSAAPAPRPAPRVTAGEPRVDPASRHAVVAALEEALNDEDEGVRKQARWALDLIRIRDGELPNANPHVRAPDVDVEPHVNVGPEVPDEDPDPEER
jgi:beta-lactamase regulating signal transducer with metallopeptidase domain